MPVENKSFHLPAYQTFIDTVSVLNLPISVSELHGIMCGYLCANAASKGEAYLQTLTSNNKDKAIRPALLALFEVYSISQHQLVDFDFEFQLLLPDDDEPLANRAKAFSEWCDGFTQGMAVSGISYDQLQEEESQEALQHLLEFAQLDYGTLEVDEEDERALLEVSEYARMAVLRLYGDLLAANRRRGLTTSKAKH